MQHQTEGSVTRMYGTKTRTSSICDCHVPPRSHQAQCSRCFVPPILELLLVFVLFHFMFWFEWGDKLLERSQYGVRVGWEWQAILWPVVVLPAFAVEVTVVCTCARCSFCLCSWSWCLQWVCRRGSCRCSWFCSFCHMFCIVVYVL